jgi:hypothetical protein
VAKIVDQFSDPTFHHFYQVFRDHPESEYLVKTASLSDEENDNRPSSSFAWPDRRLFPIDTPEHAALSRLYMEKQAGVPDEVVATCEKALKLYGIEMPLQEKVAEEQVDPQDYLLPKQQRFLVKTAEDIDMAVDAILTNQKKMGPITRAQAAFNLVKKATDLKVKLPPQIHKMAGVTMSDSATLRAWLDARADAATEPEVKEAFQKLSALVEKQPELIAERDELVKFASVVHELDIAAGFQKLYDRKLPDPIATVFNTEKIAQGMIDLAGRQVPLDTMLQIDPDVYRDVFGEDIVEEFVDEEGEIDPQMFSVILPTVPYDLQKALAMHVPGV